jgi:Ca-activated chloride channel family protein
MSMDIRWDNPGMLYGLWLLAPLAFLLARAHARRRRAAARFADLSMSQRIMPHVKGSYPWVRGALVLLAFACLGVAAARPRWGAYFETAVRRGADVMILLDVSRSMLSADVAPSRLERAKSDILDLLRRLEGDRVGLIAFAGKAVVACPLTTDQGFFRMVLERAGPDSAPRGGTAIGDAIREALKNMDRRGDRDQAMLLITDGEDHDSFPAEAASAAAERGVKIFAVGLGDPTEGARIPMVDPSGNRTYLKHQGQEVWSKMDERLLQEIALKTQGAYVPAKTTAYDLGEVYEGHLAKLARGELASEKRKRYRDRFQVFVAAALALFLLERALQPFRAKPSALATAAILVGVLSVAAGPGDKVQEGIARFKEGKLEEAWKLFSEADVSMPEDRRIAFNRGIVRHAQGDGEAARPLYEKAMSVKDPELTARAQYNLGCLEAERARTHFGEKPADVPSEKRNQGVGALQQAIRHYRSCLELEPAHPDARHNLELIRLWLKHMADLWAKKDRERQRGAAKTSRRRHADRPGGGLAAPPRGGSATGVGPEKARRGNRAAQEENLRFPQGPSSPRP